MTTGALVFAVERAIGVLNTSLSIECAFGLQRLWWPQPSRVTIRPLFTVQLHQSVFCLQGGPNKTGANCIFDWNSGYILTDFFYNF